MSRPDRLTFKTAAPRRWLSIVGIGEDGVAGLTPVARGLISEAKIVFGGKRHLAEAFGEGACHVESDVGFKQRAPNLTQCALDLGFAERAAAGEAVENAAKSFGQTIEHRSANTLAPEGASRCRAVASGLSWAGRRS